MPSVPGPPGDRALSRSIRGFKLAKLAAKSTEAQMCTLATPCTSGSLADSRGIRRRLSVGNGSSAVGAVAKLAGLRPPASQSSLLPVSHFLGRE